MKKLISILIIGLIFAFTSNIQAQNKTGNLDYNEYEYVFNLGAKDTVGILDSVYTINVYKKMAHNSDCYMFFDLDTTATASTTVVILQKGKVLDSEAWTTINTVTWSMTADTTFTMNASAKDYGRYQYTITSQLDEARFIIDDAETKFVEQ